MSSHFQRFVIPPPLYSTVHIWLNHSPPVRADSNFKYDTEFLSKNPTPNIHLHHPSRYTNTKKVSNKVKYLLMKLIQNENRESINIYLNISYGNRKKSICFKEPIHCPP